MAPVYQILPGSGPEDHWVTLPPGDTTPPGTILYLDLLHWVDLSGAKAGIERYESITPIYESLRAKVAAGEISIVLSTALYQEVAKIGPVDRRTRLADVMGELTAFRSIASIPNLLPMEFARALHKAIGRPMFPRKDPVFGVGAGFASGDPELYGRLGFDPATLVEFDAMLRQGFGVGYIDLDAELRLMCEYLLMRGPGSDIPAGYDLEALARVHDDRVQAELALRAALEADPVWVDRIEDIVAARALVWGIGERLPELIEPAGLSVDNFFGRGLDFVSALIDDVPTMATENAMRQRNHRNLERNITGNDLYDSDALRAAVPYCDVVVTDRDAAANLRSTGIAARYDTAVFAKLADLVDHLEHP